MKHEFIQRQSRIRFIKQRFTEALCQALQLQEVQAPLLTDPRDGVQDGLAGYEQAVKVAVKSLATDYEVVHSLAKWKRQLLARYQFAAGEGIVTQMRALRPDEERLSPIHSVQVDQWDWEQVILPSQRSRATLQQTAAAIYAALQVCAADYAEQFQLTTPTLPPQLTFIDSAALQQQYPQLPAKQRERMVARQYGAVLLMGIGAKLSDGQVHDLRAPDYDDWSTSDSSGTVGLNGDIILWNPVLDDAIELSSMGVRVDASALRAQLALSGQQHLATLPWHQQLLAGQLPSTIGGGIGQSRLCMWLMQQMHIGEVQSSVWSSAEHEAYPSLL
ncbi:aspartate--ammonia ligase [Idiomarina xiamenensis]|uniref:Aspartate--ammonia ligase n=1 Tax=Idiomarina xiamenensis 10-D-4 TaxID=740709 RepID=K2KM54_9GAMM|nr:aspartate--ammonia ligase [Idiomarina xiamenensis]EKE87622.1 asparagine synthetase AsnA [Idiomarina xiamenensis 10-D-4]